MKIIESKTTLTRFPEIRREPLRNYHEMDGELVDYEIINPSAPFVHNYYDDDVFYNAGGLLSRIGANIRKNKAKKQARKDLKAKGKADAAKINAQAQLAAAKAASAPDTTAKDLADILKDPTPPASPASTAPKSGLSTGAMIGIGAGVLLLVGGVIFMVMRKKKKAK